MDTYVMGPTGSDIRVVQIHPTLRCNLRCTHCYSSSSPEEAGELSSDLLRDALTDAQAEGYNALGVSGGEPLMIRALPSLLHHAKSLGMLTSVTTNGLLLTRQRLKVLQPVVDLLAISLDGVPESHNRIRNSPGAFERMARRLDDLRQVGLAFGFIFTLTQYNLDELEPVAQYAVEQGAILLQVHPLEEVGRASELMQTAAPDDLELTYAFLEIARLQRLHGNTLRIQYDAVDREVVRTSPQRLFALEPDTSVDALNQPLGELLSPLIIEADGGVVPLQYGFSRRYAIGDLKHGPLQGQMARWKAESYQAFLRLCRSVFHDQIEAIVEPPLVNWYGAITQASHGPSTIDGPLPSKALQTQQL